MKTLVPVKTAKSAVRFVASIIRKKVNLPVLAHVHVYANGCLRMMATDLDMVTSAICPAQSTTDGARLIPAQALKDVATGKTDFEIETRDTDVLLRAGENVRSVPGLDIAEFPAMPHAAPDNARQYTIPANKFFPALESVAVAQSTDDSRYVLQCVCLDIGADGARLIATDGKRMHVAALPQLTNDPATVAKIAELEAARLAAHAAFDAAINELAEIEKTSPPSYASAGQYHHGGQYKELYEKVASEDVRLAESRMRACKHAADTADEDLTKVKTAAQILIPSAAVKAILAMPADRRSETPVTIAAWMNGETPQAHVACGDFAVTTKQIQGNYPNYNQVIPHDFNRAAQLNIAEFRAALAQVEKMTTDKSNSVRLDLSGHVMTITAKSDLGTATASVPMVYEDKPLCAAFNPAYVMAACDGAEQFGATINAKFIDELSPVVLDMGAQWLAVIIPMRLS